MALDRDEVAALDERARQVGLQIGWDLRFVEARNPEHVGVTAAAIDGDGDSVNEIFVLGPSPLAKGAVSDISATLDRLADGVQRILLDEDGDPRLL